jgi:GMP synthase-like glutamine amidotransferase
VLVFGGQMNVDEEENHPWLRHEDAVIRELIAREMPLLGVCLGGQLVAKAGGAHVGPTPEPEAGFVRVALMDGARDDPLFGELPEEFDVFAVHGYAFHVPEGAVELARSRACSQAFRLGHCAWGLQFHPEVRVAQAEEWLREEPELPNGAAMVAELSDRIDEWHEFGAALCRAFLAAAEHRHTSLTVPGTAPSL